MWFNNLFIIGGFLTISCVQIFFPTANTNKEELSRRNVDINSHVFKETTAGLHLRNDLTKKERSSPDHLHEVMFIIKLLNMDELTRILLDISDPASENYGKHKTKQEVASMTSNPTAIKKINDYFNSVGASMISKSLAGQYITARGTIKIWETMFNTKFYESDHIYNEEITNTVVRAEEYSVPLLLDQFVDSVFHTVQMPHVM